MSSAPSRTLIGRLSQVAPTVSHGWCVSTEVGLHVTGAWGGWKVSISFGAASEGGASGQGLTRPGRERLRWVGGFRLGPASEPVGGCRSKRRKLGRSPQVKGPQGPPMQVRNPALARRASPPTVVPPLTSCNSPSSVRPCERASCLILAVRRVQMGARGRLQPTRLHPGAKQPDSGRVGRSRR